MQPAERRSLARELALEGLRACGAGTLLRNALSSAALDARSARRTLVIAAGKAADPMVDAFLAWGGRLDDGMIATPAPKPRGSLRVASFAAGHPRPNQNSVLAARAALHLAANVHGDDRLVVLLSGGASALMAAPARPVTLDDKIALTQWLLEHGVAIDDLNTVRRHLSMVKGGQLGRGAGVPTTTFALSDVSRPRDDDPSTIGSGPTVADPTTYADAWRVLDAIDAEWPARWPRVAERLRLGLDGRVPETPKPGDSTLAGSSFTVIGNRHTAARAAAARARARGLAVRVREAALDGEAREAARVFIAEGQAFAREAMRPCCYIASGETTVTVRGKGLGGRNQEFALAGAVLLAETGETATLAALGTDGIDGPTIAAGAIVDEGTIGRGYRADRDAARTLAANDSHHYLTAVGETLVSGPTDSNVGDLAILLMA